MIATLLAAARLCGAIVTLHGAEVLRLRMEQRKAAMRELMAAKRSKP